MFARQFWNLFKFCFSNGQYALPHTFFILILTLSLFQDCDTFKDSVNLSVSHIRQRELPPYVHKYRQTLGFTDPLPIRTKSITQHQSSHPLCTNPANPFQPSFISIQSSDIYTSTSVETSSASPYCSSEILQSVNGQSSEIPSQIPTDHNGISSIPERFKRRRENDHKNGETHESTKCETKKLKA